MEMASETSRHGDIDDCEVSDEGDRPSGERWAPVGANDGDSDFQDEYKYDCENLPYDMERLKVLEEEQEMLNTSLIALTTHFAQVQFRLRQIMDAPAEEKETLLKELEEFAFRGIPDVPNSLKINEKYDCGSQELCKSSSMSDLAAADIESKMNLQKTKQKELINQLKSQLEELEKYAYDTGNAEDLPQSVMLERQAMIINHLKEKLNFDVDDLCTLPIDDLRWQVDYAISQVISPLKMKEQLVTQLKTQIADLERFINYLQGEVSPETLACTCACPVHTNSSFSKRTSRRTLGEETQANNLNTVRKLITVLHMYVISQLGCSSQKAHRGIKKNTLQNWRDLRTKLDIAVEHVLITAAQTQDLENGQQDVDYASDSEIPTFNTNAKVTTAVRKHLAVCIRDLLQHGLRHDVRMNSVVPFVVGCFPQRSQMSVQNMHAWELVLKYYEVKNGQRYNCSPAQKLSQSFNLDLNPQRAVSSKQALLVTIGNIIASHMPYRRGFDSHFKAFICAALNANKLVIWLKLILQCQYLLESHYTSWSYVVRTGFQDAFHTLDRLTSHKFDLPVDLAVRQFQNIKDAF